MMSTFPSPVAKPSTAGVGQLAIARTASPYENLETAPVQITVMSEIFVITQSLFIILLLEPAQVGFGLSRVPLADGYQIQLSRSKMLLLQCQSLPVSYPLWWKIWHLALELSIPETTIDDVARNIKTVAPNVTQVWVKICDATPRDGAQWQGYWDTKRSSRIDGRKVLIGGLPRYASQ